MAHGKQRKSDLQLKLEAFPEAFKGTKSGERYHLMHALETHIEMKNEALVRETAQTCLEQELFYTAFKGFEFLKDRPGMLTSALGEVNSDFTKVLFYTMLRAYIGKDTIEQIDTKLNQWLERKNCIGARTLGNLPPEINIAHNLAGEYDVGVAVANGGLLSGFFFENYGLPVKVAETHRKTRSNKIQWKTPIDESAFKDKHVLVIENDIVTGKTAARIIQELSKYKPAQVDIALNLNPLTNESAGIGCRAENIPNGYSNRYFPKSFDYNRFDVAIAKLEQSLNAP